jgi:predicted  nucleic acid-binding Zn-ribbon protein
MDIRILTQRIEHKIAAFSHKIGLPADTHLRLSGGSQTHPEIDQLKQDLGNMSTLYEESMCVWEHEMELLKSRLAETAYHTRELEILRSSKAIADQEIEAKNQEITRLFARVEELKKENELLESDTHRLSTQLRTAWKSTPLNGFARQHKGMISRLKKWLCHQLI